MENETICIDKNEFSKLVEMFQEIQDRLEALELASDSEVMGSLKKSKEEIANGEVVDLDDL